MGAIEVLINSVLKYLGFSRQQFDEGLSHVRQEFDSLKHRARVAEERSERLERSMAILLAHHGLVVPGESALVDALPAPGAARPDGDASAAH